MTKLIDAYEAHLRAAGRSPQTIAKRINHLRRLHAELQPHGLDHAATCELEASLGRAGLSSWTRYIYFEHAWTFYVWATTGRTPRLAWNPMEDMQRPTVPRDDPRPVPDEQIAQALTLLHDPWRRGVLIATMQGLRCAEICALDREHVTDQDLYVTRKGNKTQLLPTHPAVWDALAALPPGPVVRTPLGRRFNPTHYSGRMSEALTAIGLAEATLHRFRAAYATRCAENGVHATVIQNLMGHASLNTTQRYVLVRDAQRRLAVNSLRVPTPTLQAAA